MTEFINRTVCNYNTLATYNGGGLGVGAVARVEGPSMPGINIVPVFNNRSYSYPDYNVLTQGSCGNHVDIHKAYGQGDCVRYVDRPCGGNIPHPSHRGHTGPHRF